MQPYLNYQLVKRGEDGKIKLDLNISTNETVTNPFSIQGNTTNIDNTYRSLCAYDGNNSIVGFRHRLSCSNSHCLSVSCTNAVNDDIILEARNGTTSNSGRKFHVRASQTINYQPLVCVNSASTTNPYSFDVNNSLTGYKNTIFHDDSTTNTLAFRHRFSNQTGNVFSIRRFSNVTDGSTNLLQCSIGPTDGTGHNRFVVHDNGTVDADVFNVVVSDYAEAFEWFDGNPKKEDRYGRIVSLVEGTNKIEYWEGKHPYPLGVTKPFGSSAIVGNMDGLEWNKKFLRNEWNMPIYNNRGEQILNPAYNKDIEHIPRSKRKEWACVGLLGVCPILKSEVEKPIHWRKMNDINDKLCNYFIR